MRTLHFMYFNLHRIHQSRLVTPAMAASIQDHLWPLADRAALTDSDSN